jgi:hypothetical protein
MPHGLSIDRTATDVAFRNGLLENRGSFISNRDQANDRAHIHLEGIDRSRQRTRCFLKSKQKCAICRRPIGFDTFEMHHPGTCDCIDPKCPTHVEARCSQFENDCHRHHSKNFKRKAPKVQEVTAKSQENTDEHGTSS